MVAVIEVVVVLPWLPATAIPYFNRINSASSSPRGNHGDLQAARFQHLGILLIHGGADHQRPRAGDVGGGVPFVNARTQPGQAAR